MDKTDVGFVMKKDICFHELSVPYPVVHNEDVDSLIQKYADTIKEANNQGFNKVRYENGVDYIMLRDDYSLAQYLYANSTKQSVTGGSIFLSENNFHQFGKVSAI